MKTYTIFRGDQRLKNDALISDAFELLPAGSELVSGNRVERVIVDGKLEDVITEIRSIYKSQNGDRFTIIQNT